MFHPCEWHPEKPDPFYRCLVLKSLGLEQIERKWFGFTFLEGNYFYSCSTLPLISFILTAFPSSGTRASVSVTWVIVNQPCCSIHHCSEWQQHVSCLSTGSCGVQNSFHQNKTQTLSRFSEFISTALLFHPSSYTRRWMSVQVTSLGTLEVQLAKLCQR